MGEGRTAAFLLRDRGYMSEDRTKDPNLDPWAAASRRRSLAPVLRVEDFQPLSALINSFNRAVGHGDAYPFVLTPPVIEKLGFIHALAREAGAAQWTVPGPSGEPVPINTPAG